MFLMPIPEDWEPAAHGWEADEGNSTADTLVCLRWAPPVRFPAALTVFRNEATGQRVAWYGPLATAGHGEAAPQGVLFAEVGIASAESASQGDPI